MNHPKHPHSESEDRREAGGPSDPYWKRAHHDWKFWIALVLMLTAMGVYIVTLDLSVRPDPQNLSPVQQQTP